MASTFQRVEVWYALVVGRSYTAMSTCIKCGHHDFELKKKEAEPKGSNFEFYFVQCSSCGGVVGVGE